MTAAPMLDAAALLSGPRGRRLCLQAAVLLDEDVRQAAFYAAHTLDPGAGTSRVMFSLGGGRVENPPGSVPDVVAALGRAPRLRIGAAGPTEAELWQALDEAVNTARYWQEPDGEDVLAALPEVRAALEPMAAAVGASPAAAWWTTPLDRFAQCAVVWHTDGVPNEARTGGRVELDAWRAAAAAEEAGARRDRPQDPVASFSGTWWSTPPWAIARTTRHRGKAGPVGFLVEDGFGWERATVCPVAVPVDARVVEIDGPAAWAALCRRYPLEVTASRRHDWYRVTGADPGTWVQPDWAAVAQDVDGVHLTVGGYLTTAGLLVPIAEGVASVLAGWDPDATFWLTGPPAGRDDGAEVEEWELDRGESRWRRRPD